MAQVPKKKKLFQSPNVESLNDQNWKKLQSGTKLSASPVFPVEEKNNLWSRIQESMLKTNTKIDDGKEPLSP